jgi:hypothetical protein
VNWSSPEFVVLIVGISTLGWLVNNWIRARHGYPLEDEWGGKTGKAETDATRKLASENAELREQLTHFADRVKVLERIVTDKSTSVAAQIEALRDAPELENRK